MNTTPLVSIIILAYNVEQYIEECLTSIINQTYENLEVIVVINGKSKDKTEEIAQSFALQDNRVKFVYNQKNSVIGDGRILGMEAVAGTYFTFVDGDDCLPEGSIDYLVNLIEADKADVVIGETVRFSNSNFPIILPSYANQDIEINLIPLRKYICRDVLSIWIIYFMGNCIGLHYMKNQKFFYIQILL